MACSNTSSRSRSGGIGSIQGLVGPPPDVMQENRGPVFACWPRIRSATLRHSRAAGQEIQQSLRESTVADGGRKRVKKVPYF